MTDNGGVGWPSVAVSRSLPVEAKGGRAKKMPNPAGLNILHRLC